MANDTFSHYEAITQRLNMHKAKAKTATGDQLKWSLHNIKMIERDLEGELEFLEESGVDTTVLTMSDEDLLAELGAL